jgi:hypothetical protein
MTSSKTGSVLDRIRTLQERKFGLKFSIYGEPKTGKCLGLGTPVLMYDGDIKPVEEIKIGDQLMGPDSKPRNVLGTGAGKGRLYRITPSRGESWVCNDIHVLTLKGIRGVRDKVRDVQLNIYMDELERGVPHSGSWRLFSVGVEFKTREPLPFDPYLIGLWMGDGTVGIPEISNRDERIIEYCREWAYRNGMCSKVTPGRTTQKVTITASLGSGNSAPGANKLLLYLREKCSVGRLKTIPREYLVASRSDRLNLLAGIVDTDGHGYSEDYPIIQVGVTGELYRDSLLFLARSLGFMVSIQSTRIHECVNGKVSTYYRINISGDTHQIPTRCRNRTERVCNRKPNLLPFVVDLEQEEGDYYGFELDGDGRFLLGNFQVTHNTRFASTFPKPLLVIGFEDGTESIIGTEGVQFVQLEKTEELNTLIDGPIKAGDYATVVIDHATRMRDMRLAEIAGYKSVPVQNGWGMYTWDHYREAAGAMKLMLSRLFDLSNRTQMNTVIIAQEGNLVKEDDTGKGSDLVKPAIASAVGKGVADFINAECDYIGQMCKREEVRKVKTKIGNNEVPIDQPTGKVKYYLRVGPHSVYYTGFRQHIGTPELPDFIEAPTYEKVLELIRGK